MPQQVLRLASQDIARLISPGVQQTVTEDVLLLCFYIGLAALFDGSKGLINVYIGGLVFALNSCHDALQTPTT
jgi:hypothetical protein